MDELTVIMRSLGMSPTITELKSYMRDRGGKISFADFLEIMHGHSKKESIPRELLEAFRGMDPQRKGYIPAKVVEYMPLGALLDLPLLRICGTYWQSGVKSSALEKVRTLNWVRDVKTHFHFLSWPDISGGQHTSIRTGVLFIPFPFLVTNCLIPWPLFAQVKYEEFVKIVCAPVPDYYWRCLCLCIIKNIALHRKAAKSQLSKSKTGFRTSQLIFHNPFMNNKYWQALIM